jgi:peptidoglycan/xylan/chitin deacetylase (PgdA/CDA1 family)
VEPREITVRNALFRLVALSGLPGAWRALQPHGATILTYHGFTDVRSFEGVLDHQRMRLHIDAFRRHVEHLVSHYHVVSLSTLVSRLRENRELPKRAVVITFDDGYRSCYTLANPVLKEFGAPAAFFIATDFVFDKRPLWHDRVEYAFHATREAEVDLGEGRVFRCGAREEKVASLRALYRLLKRVDQGERDVLIDDLERRAAVRLDLETNAPDLYAPIEPRELENRVAEGLVEVGSHTKTHAVLSRCNGERLGVEVTRSRDVLERALGQRCHLFCYPNGTKSDFDSRTTAALVDAGFSCALTTIPGRNVAGADTMELRRIGAPADPAEFRVAASGVRAALAGAYHATRRALGRGTEPAGGM